MLESRRLVLPLTGGVIVGIVFAYLSRSVESVSQILTILATVQGSFLAIVVSVFLLSLQVNAGEFGSFVVDEIEDSSLLQLVISIFVGSILLDILYIALQEHPIYVANTNWNLSLGIPIAAATICFLTLIPIKSELTEQVDPEQILQRTSKSVDWDSINATGINRENPRLSEQTRPPERTALLVIEQIMSASDERSDELTLRQSIYYMSESTAKLIESKSAGDVDSKKWDALFEHWERCIQTGKDGDTRRLLLLADCHLSLVQSLFQNNRFSYVERFLTEWEGILFATFEAGYTDPEMVKLYTEMVEPALDSNDPDQVESIISSLLSVTKELTTEGGKYEIPPSDLTGENRDLIAKSLCASFECLSEISSHDETDGMVLKRVTRSTVSRFETILSGFRSRLSSLEDEDDLDIESIERNVLSQIQETILIESVNIFKNNELVGKNLAHIAIELSVYLEQTPAQFVSDLQSASEERDGRILEVLRNEAKADLAVEPSLVLEDVDQAQVQEFVSQLETSG